jgi:hypothetical protein
MNAMEVRHVGTQGPESSDRDTRARISREECPPADPAFHAWLPAPA